MNEPRSLSSQVYKGLLQLALIGGIGALLAWKLGADFSRTFEALQKLSWKIFFVLCLSYAGLVFMQVLRHGVLAKQFFPIRFRELYWAKWLAGFLNLVVPAKLGDFARVDWISRQTSVPGSRILSTVVIDLWFDKLGWLLAFALAACVSTLQPWMKSVFIGVASISVISFVVLRVLEAYKPAWAVRKLAAFFDAFAALKSPRIVGSQVLVAPLSWLWESITLMLLIRAAGHGVSLGEAFTVLSVMNFAMIVPTPGNLVTFETSAVLGMAWIGIPHQDALAISLVYHGSQLASTLVFGGGFFALRASGWAGERLSGWIALARRIPAEKVA